jgi:ribosomal protein S11
MKITIFSVLFLITTASVSINSQWVQTSGGMGNLTVLSFASSGDTFFAGTDYYGVYVSTDNGTTWVQTSLNNRIVTALAKIGSNLYAGAISGGIFISTNNGTNWTQSSLTVGVSSIAESGNNILVSSNSSGGGIYYSSNNGINWSNTSISSGIFWPLAVNGNDVFAGSNGVWKSTNNGINWTQTSFNNRLLWSLAANGNIIFAGCIQTYGVYKSTDNGTSWAQTSLNNRVVRSLAVDGDNVYAGTSDNGVYVSNDNGMNWVQRNEGLGNATVRALHIIGNYIYAGTVNNGVWKREIDQLVGIQSAFSEIPNNYSLSQNYPNPFNPTTAVKYDLPEDGMITLKIHDILGREIYAINEFKKAGSYSLKFDGSNYSSGIYFYRLESGSYIETKKMVLVK